MKNQIAETKLKGMKIGRRYEMQNMWRINKNNTILNYREHEADKINFNQEYPIEWYSAKSSSVYRF